MNEGTRFGTAMHSPKVVQNSDAYTQSTDGKGKAPPPDGRIFLVGLSLRALPPSRRLALQPETSTISSPRQPSPPHRADLRAMSRREDDFHVQPGRIRDPHPGAKRPKTFVGEVMRAAKKAGIVAKRSVAGRLARAGAVRTRPASRPLAVAFLNVVK